MKSSFFIYYGRDLRQLTNVQNYGLLGPTPMNGKSNVLVDLHPLAQIDTIPTKNGRELMEKWVSELMTNL